jgi:hypothetical protein
VGSAPFGQLLLLAADPPGDLVGLLGVDRGQDAGEEQAIGVADVDLARDRRDVPGAGAVTDFQQFLRLPGLSDEPVQVVDDHGVDGAFLKALQHLVVALAGLVRVLGGGQVVVAVLLDDGPAQAAGECLSVLALPADPQAASLGVAGHAQVQASLDHSASFASGVVVLGNYGWWPM